MVGSEVGKIGGSFSTEGGKLSLEGKISSHQHLPFSSLVFFMVKTSCKIVTHLILNSRSQSDSASLEACGWWWGKMAAGSPPPRRGLEDDCWGQRCWSHQHRETNLSFFF